MQLFAGGPIHTLADAGATALLVADDKIVAAGDAALRLAEQAPSVERTELNGRAIVPGFIDAHHHLGAAALYRGTVDCRPTVVPGNAELVSAFSAVSRTVPAGRWVLGFGYDEWAMREGRAPTREELDAACPDHPALAMHFSFHQGVANTRALELAGIGRCTKNPVAGRIERGRRGEPTGRLYEMAIAGVERLATRDMLARDPDGFVERLVHYQQELFSIGITRVADPTVTTDLERLYHLALASGRLQLPVLMMPVSDHGYLAQPHDVLAASSRLNGAPSGEGSETLRVGPLKLFFDGGDNCAMCLSIAQGIRAALASAARMARAKSVREALLPVRFGARIERRFGGDFHLHTGLKYYRSDQDAISLARAATERGFALAIHAMGNEAVEQALRVYAALGGQSVGVRRVEHAMVVDDRIIRGLADSGATVVSQPSFMRIPAVEFLPPLHGLRVLAHRSMRDAGITVAGSSDAPVGEASPLLGMHDAVVRTRSSGRPLDADERISALDALAMYTRDAAAACGWSDVAGTLEAGRSADFVILSGDPASAPLNAIQVEETVLAGRTVYRRATATAS